MIELLASWDTSVFHVINQTLANPVTDLIMPALTDWNKSAVGWILAGGAWLALVLRGGMKGKIIAVMLLAVVGVCDQISSNVLKDFFARPRPCHDSALMARLLVDCGSGFSFPSSHAVNNSALAVLLSWHYRRWWWVFAVYAFLMCISRVVVGVHYPSDILGGAALGAGLGWAGALAAGYVLRRIEVLKGGGRGA